MTDANDKVVEVSQELPRFISNEDRMALELAKAKRQVALADAKTALANNDKEEIAYNYLILQLYMKYGMTSDDSLNPEDGTIVKGGALQQKTK